MKTFTFHLHGMHCVGCEKLAELELRGVPGVSSVRASLARQSVEIAGDFAERQPEALICELGPLLKKHGFSLSLEPVARGVKWSEFAIAAPVALALMGLFIFAQKIGLGKLITSSEMGYGMAFLVGVIASVSSCMAIVGGLVLSLTAYYAQKGEKVRPQILFHIGRLISFFVLGGIAGAAGSVFQPSVLVEMLMGLFIGGVMVLMGVRLLDVFHWSKRWQLALPRSVGDRIHALQGRRTAVMPFLLGAATFFLPCGFTQSMQLYTLTTGHFSTGALTMFCFALGTFPVLALLSFSTLGTRGREQSGVFFKTAGLLVVFFGLYDMINSLVGYGLIRPFLNF
jgi:sulfite exporter TauE/SafE/copper chaperone CopZ